jgi:hypothetical protein
VEHIKTQKAQLNVKFQIHYFQYALNIAWDRFKLKSYSLFIGNSNLTGCPVFFLATPKIINPS